MAIKIVYGFVEIMADVFHRLDLDILIICLCLHTVSQQRILTLSDKYNLSGFTISTKYDTMYLTGLGLQSKGLRVSQS